MKRQVAKSRKRATRRPAIAAESATKLGDVTALDGGRDTKPLAFVAMPFSLLSNQVFTGLIEPSLEAAGYRVLRADTTDNLRLIMRDIVEGIQQAELVVADLTGRNANVFWEVGLAHGLRKQVMLLAQSAADIPFDLGGYRAIVYSLDADKPFQFTGSLSGDLSKSLAAMESGSVRFGDPLSDFGFSPDVPASPDSVSQGLLDQAMAAQDEAPLVGEKIHRMAELLNQLNAEMTATNDQLGPSRPGRELHRAQQIFAAYAPIWDRYATSFEHYVDAELLPMTLKAQQGIPAFLKLGEMQKGRPAGRAAFLASVAELSEAARAYVALFLEMATTIREYSQLTGPLMEPGQRLAAVLERVAGLFAQLVSLHDELEAISAPPLT